MPKRIYFKRHRMEIDLRHPRPPAELPEGFYWLPWQRGAEELHAQVKYRCFIGELDSRVFPCLATLPGCRELMVAIASRPGFCPHATWLAVAGSSWNWKSGICEGAGVPCGFGSDVCVATVQGLVDSGNYGGIQNLGVVPEYRARGLGWAVLLKSLEGFASSGVSRVFLEVTAKNERAVRMYRRLGFRNYKTIYREVEIEDQTNLPIDREAVPKEPLPELAGLH